MNFYKRHLGDIAKSCSDLSQGQMGAYDLLLDWHYANEKPIPLAADKAHRIGRAVTKTERENVDSVLIELFTRTENGYTHKRAMEEMEEAQESIDDAEARRKNEADRKSRYRKRRKELFEALRLLDIVPDFDTPIEELERTLSHGTCAGQVQGQARHVPSKGTAIHKPLATNHQDQKLPATPGAGAPADPDPIFGNGLAFLVRKGIAEKGARGFLGAMRKEVRDDLIVTELLIEAERNDVCDPLAWLRAAGRKRARAGPQAVAIGKTAQAIQALEDMKHGNRLGIGRDFDGHAEAAAALAGKHAGQ